MIGGLNYFAGGGGGGEYESKSKCVYELGTLLFSVPQYTDEKYIQVNPSVTWNSILNTNECLVFWGHIQ